MNDIISSEEQRLLAQNAMLMRQIEAMKKQNDEAWTGLVIVSMALLAMGLWVTFEII